MRSSLRQLFARNLLLTKFNRIRPIKSSLELIDAFSNAQNGINQYLEYDVEAFKKRYRQLREEYYAILDDGNLTSHLNELISLKKDIGYLLLDVNQASVVNGGSRAYTPYSPQVRKLKEGFSCCINADIKTFR